MIRPDDDEPAVRQPRLLELVERARAQPLPPLRTGSDAILRAVAQRRSARTRAAVIGVVLCAAAAWVLWARAVPTWTRVADEAPLDQAARALDGADAGGEATPRALEVTATPRAPAPSPIPIAPPPIEPVDADSGAQTPVESAVAEPASVASAATLAREAERAMAERRRDDAIGLLARIVREHPRHPAAKAALFDLGRLYRDAGRTDEARCAYQMLVRRWPDGPGSDEVGAVLGALGAGPRCRGLRPIRPARDR